MRLKIWVWLVIGVLAAQQLWAASEVSAVSEVSAAKVMSETEWREMATKKNCLLCHEMGRDGLGPSLREISEEYVGKGDAEELLLKKVYEGGVGNWGGTMMPAQARHSSPEEVRALVRYILHLNGSTQKKPDSE
jgi:cytochrome c